MGPGFLNQVPTLGWFTVLGFGLDGFRVERFEPETSYRKLLKC